jgi:hypothetical protein
LHGGLLKNNSAARAGRSAATHRDPALKAQASFPPLSDRSFPGFGRVEKVIRSFTQKASLKVSSGDLALKISF